ncbi:MAG: pyrimidine-nucleoside phosphorylase [Erysipelothrix sp.]|jgi:pyrimidine-nucleoside phosphorylase|nr:pyrimidine-nucleoside phosphorylase [Erysipelothrix sp.]
MNMIDIISKKRDGQALSQAEIQYWVDAMVADQVPDYQSSALLMAIYINGFNEQETSDLTLAMAHSGDVVDLSSIAGKIADKHSTGGVGDKTSLVLTPLVAACGGKVAKMSGKGLGHTGGTIDKLAAIPGFSTSLDSQRFIQQVNDINCAIIEQTANLVPADKILYALRDVTATVSAVPLIASSIMSKKLASGADTILLDVKYGDGAFMATKEAAIELAETMISIGNNNNRDTRAIISSMEQPLGYSIGNALEVKEAIDTLRDEGPEDLRELCVEAASIMLVQSKVHDDIESAKAHVEEVLASHQALEKFKEMIQAQDGDPSVVDFISKFPKSNLRSAVLAPQSGYIAKIHAQNLGMAAVALGAGRQVKDDPINYGVGIVLTVKVGDPINKDDALCIVYHDEPIEDAFLEQVMHDFEISDKPVAASPLIETILD